jgi:hypothetical protein
MVREQSLGYAAGAVVTTGDGIAVKKQDWRSRTPVAVVQPNPVHFHKQARRRMPALRPPGKDVVDDGH